MEAAESMQIHENQYWYTEWLRLARKREESSLVGIGSIEWADGTGSDTPAQHTPRVACEV